ncbi:MAG: ATP-dependent DNA helicase, partial [Candidatus Promineifilaceae bacterium]
WIEWYRDQLSLHAAPLHVGKLVDNHMWERLDSVILTSATMRTAPQGRQNLANFDYIRARLQADEETVQELSVGSPFNYKKNTLLYLCSDIPEPRQPGYQRMVEEAIVDIATTYGGQTLVLFTSYKQLSETARIIEPKLAEENIRVLAQTQKISRQQLTAQFKADNARAVLLGTKSFWEGVDVPGPALSAVVLVKLPFDVPTDPVIGARSETFNNSFMEYALPESVLRFRQGFGRLIRRKSDEGVVVVLDKRVLTKRYGELFINALPQCVTLRKRTQRIPEILKRWQNRDRS